MDDLLWPLIESALRKKRWAVLVHTNPNSVTVDILDVNGYLVDSITAPHARQLFRELILYVGNELVTTKASEPVA